MSKAISRRIIALCCAALFSTAARPLFSQSSSLGIFEGQSDVGSVTPPGTAAYANGVYTLTAAGANIWSNVDAFHLVWKKVSGDISLSADITFPDSSGNPNPHRKAVLMFRQTLDADDVYADAAQHGSGLTALQYRTAKGDTTQDIELNIDLPSRVRLEKRGDTISMFLSLKGEPLHHVGASIKLGFRGPFYAGIGLCSHDAKVVEKAVFTNVEMKPLEPLAASVQPALYSTLKTISIDDTARVATVVNSQAADMQAPIWSKDGSYLVFNQGGRMWKIAAKGGTPEPFDTGNASHCGGSHGFSPDGKSIAITCETPDKPGARIYIFPASGGTPRLVTENPQSYFHTWSPDGKTIAFARPDGKGGGNIVTISVDGGAEKALTTGPGVSDDPDYSADGQYIYFNSNRGGTMQIWRMHTDGTNPEQITSDDYANWTPHPSPDGKSLLILSYDKSVTGHPPNKDVALRIMSLDDRKIRVLTTITGGSGTDNTPNWAPDGKHFAFVSYQMLPGQQAAPTQ
jgi:TolB protein